MEKHENSNSVKSIMKAFAIIELLNDAGPLSISELSNHLSMDKATVHRLINTIKQAGYVIQNPETKKYSNSIKLFEIGQNVITKTGLFEAARPHIEALASATGESINLGIVKDNEIIYVDKKEGKSTIKVGIKIGTSVPMHCTGMGKAVLAFMNKNVRDEIISRIEYIPYSKNSPLDRKTVEQRLEETARNGYSMDSEEYVNDLISYGAPIFGYKGEPVAAISISFPKSRLNENEMGKEFPDLIKTAALNISRQMGYIV